MQLIDSNRPYIIMDEQTWYWATIPEFSKEEFVLSTRIPPKSVKKLVLLEDYRAGEDGRVWLTCSMKGNLCVIKFGSLDEKDPKVPLEQEAQRWREVWGLDARVIMLGGNWALMMPRVRTISKEKLSKDQISQVQVAVQHMADKHYYHKDLKWEHVAWASPVKKGNPHTAVFLDLCRVEKKENCKACFTQMMNDLGLEETDPKGEWQTFSRRKKRH
ncbi:MAG: hypothetical protein ACYCT1_20035 [Steroidobacteraceae bacterium]